MGYDTSSTKTVDIEVEIGGGRPAPELDAIVEATHR
jgi:hypothetical protein